MKRIMAAVWAVLMILMALIPTAMAQEEITAGGGDFNVNFSNGYIGFCINYDKQLSSSGDQFVAGSMSDAVHNDSNSPVADILKRLIVKYSDQWFVLDGNRYYCENRNLQYAIWTITDDATLNASLWS